MIQRVESIIIFTGVVGKGTLDFAIAGLLVIIVEN
jgi:hypothetical protein